MSRKAFPILFVMVSLVLLTGVAFGAQEGEEKVVASKSLWDLFKSTGVVGILLVVTSIIGTALLIQYMVNLTEPKLGNPALLSEIEALLSEGDLDGAYTLAQSDQSYAGKLMAGAIGRSTGGFEETKKGMEEAGAVEVFRINAKVSYLSLIGNIGPLLGLLGTVTGMISAFQKIETVKSPTPADLAVGVYESLVNTTMGLFIGIVFLSAYFFMKNKVSDITLRLNNAVGEIVSRTLSPEAQQQQGAQGK